MKTLSLKVLHFILAIFVLLSTAACINSITPPNTEETSASNHDRTKKVEKFPSDMKVQYFNGPEPTLLPTLTISKGNGSVRKLTLSPIHLDVQKINYIWQGKKIKVNDLLKETGTDAFIVLKNGQLVYEKYFGQNPASYHWLYSITKSFAGLMAATLIVQGKLKRSDFVIHYVPELKNTAYAKVTVNDLLEQSAAIQFNEAYHDHQSDIFIYSAKAILGEKANIHQALQTINSPSSLHGKKFNYLTPNIDALCWVAERAGKQKFSKWVENTIWSKIGMHQNAQVIVDKQQVEFCGGGLEASAIDLAIFGQLLADNGRYQNKVIIPAAVINEIKKGGHLPLNSDASISEPHPHSYQDNFWIIGDQDHSFMARGIFGQWIFINPTQKVVIVKLSTQKTPSASDLNSRTLAAFQAIIQALSMRSKRSHTTKIK